MTPPPHNESTNEVAPGESLRRALDALPAERTPPAETWAQLQQAMTASRPTTIADKGRVRALVNRRTARMATLGVAALLTVVLATGLSRGRGGARGAAPAVLLPEERADPRVRAVLDETRNWRAASADSVRSMRWPLEAREAIESALVSTERALASARVVLHQHPDDVAARDAIASLRSKQLVLLQRAMTLLDEI